MLRTNRDKLPIVGLQGQVWPSKTKNTGRMTGDGEVLWVQGTGGITYNAQIGDICTGWVADHLEPGVTTRHPDEDFNWGYTVFSCIGNEATVSMGDAKGGKGFVTGKHGGVEHTILYFPPEVLEKLTLYDKIDVKAAGQGMKLLDYPEILLRSMSPALLDKMNIVEDAGRLRVGVAKIVPACLMGSGIGSFTSVSGDFDITLHDEALTAEYGLETLRFGDIVAIKDSDTRYGRTYRGGAVSIGVIVHGDSNLNGHGPGVTSLMACKTALIEPFIDSGANLANYFLPYASKPLG
jgi:hypothetical protein